MLLLASPTGLLAPVQPSVLNEGDRVRVLWGPGEMHDAMVTDRRTELRKRNRIHGPRDKARLTEHIFQITRQTP